MKWFPRRTNSSLSLTLQVGVPSPVEFLSRFESFLRASPERDEKPLKRFRVPRRVLHPPDGGC